jgi:hypothetical protein
VIFTKGEDLKFKENVMHRLTDWNLAHLVLKAGAKQLYKGVIENNSELIEAAISKDPELIHTNLGDGIHYLGFRAMHWAGANGHLQAIQTLKKYGADIHQRAGFSLDEYGGTLPLETAAHCLWETGHPQRQAIVNELRIDPANISSPKELLYLGAITNDRTYIDEALKRRVDIDMDLTGFKDWGFRATHWAAKYRNLEALLWLIGKGADTELQTSAGLTYKQILEVYLTPEQKINPVKAIFLAYRKPALHDLDTLKLQLPESMLSQIRVYLNLKDALRLLELFVPHRQIKSLNLLCQQCLADQRQDMEGFIKSVLTGHAAPMKMIGLR